MYYLCNRILYKEVRMRFLGNIEAKVDAKGRVFLPATFRKMLLASGEDALMLRKDVFQDCLVLYPESVWNEQMDLMRQRLNRWDKREQLVFRQFVSQVEGVTGKFSPPKRRGISIPIRPALRHASRLSLVPQA